MTTSTLPSDLAAQFGPATRRLLDAKQVAARLGCSWRTVLRLADSGKMPIGLKIGALRRWDAAALEAWIDGGCKPCRTAGGRS